MDKKNLEAKPESSETSSLDFVSHFTQCWWCIPSNTTLFVLGYINLIFNITFGMFFIPISFYCAIYNKFESAIPECDATLSSCGQRLTDIMTPNFLLGFASKTDVDFLPIQSFDSPTVAVMIYSVLKSCVIVLNGACLICLHQNKPGPIKLINGLSALHLAYTIYSVIIHHLYIEFAMYSVVLRAIEIGLAAYFAVLYYCNALQMREQEDFDDQSTFSIQQVYIDYPFTVDKAKLCDKL